MVSALDFQAGYRWFESRSGRDNFQIIITPSSYSTCPGLSIKWTGRCLVIDSGTKCAWVIHESKAVQIHLHHSNRRCLYVPRVPGSVKNPHNNNRNIMIVLSLKPVFYLKIFRTDSNPVRLTFVLYRFKKNASLRVVVITSNAE